MLKRPVPGKKQWTAMLLLSVGLSSGFAYVAWAAQPAPIAAAAAQAEVYTTFVEATLDGTTQRFELRQPAGMPFSFSANSDKGVQWAAEFILKPSADGLLKLQGNMKADGVLVSSPILSMAADKPARIEVSTRDGRSIWKLQLRSQPQAVAAVAAGGVSQGHALVTGPLTSVQASVDAGSKAQAPPSYPKSAFEQGISGKVVLQIDVGADGRTNDVQVVESQPQGVFDAVSIAAARQWRFNPAYKDGMAIAGKVRVPIWFDLDENVVHTDSGVGS